MTTAVERFGLIIAALLVIASTASVCFGEQPLGYYPLERTFEPIPYPVGTPSGAKIREGALNLTGVVLVEPVGLESNRVIDTEAASIGFTGPDQAWHAAVSSRTSRIVEQVEPIDNAGVVTTVQDATSDDWGAYIQALQNEVYFYPATSDVYVTPSGHTAGIARVMVSSLGDWVMPDRFFRFFFDEEYPLAIARSPTIRWDELATAPFSLDAYESIRPERAYALRPEFVVVPNNGDCDRDGVPDFADGYNRDGVSGNKDDECDCRKVTLWRIGVPDYMELECARLEFEYSFSDPTSVSFATNQPPQPGYGNMRIWKKGDDGERVVIPNGLYDAESLGLSGTNRHLDLEIEAVVDEWHDDYWNTSNNTYISVRIWGDGEGSCSNFVYWSNPYEYNLPVANDSSFFWPGGYEQADVMVVNPRIVPDWNRDRTIDTNDSGRVTTANPFRFWINDDDDDGDIAKGDSDVPGQGSLLDKANYQDSIVNGRCDLLDFFPIWLDLHDTLNLFRPDEGYAYRLRQADSALRFVYTGLTADDAGSFHIVDSNVYGVAFNVPAHEAESLLISDDGIDLIPDLLNGISENKERGILMVEAVAETTSPLVLEVRHEGKVIVQEDLPIRLSGVEKMYRHRNLRTDGNGVPDRLNSPENWPDEEAEDHAMMFVHGYNVDGQGSRGIHAEIFKRLWQTGFNGKFVGVSWFGDVDEFLTNLGPSEYHQSIAQAFAVADELAGAIAEVKATVAPIVDVIAHSAGNMVVGSAVQDHNSTFRNYIALDAAVPLEAYGANVQLAEDSGGFAFRTGSGVDTEMVSSAAFDEGLFSVFGYSWGEYDARLHATEWYRLFQGSPDERKNLTWRNRFDRVGRGNPTGFNFYSSTEEVLRNYQQASLIHGSFMDWLKVLYNVSPMPGGFDLEAGVHFSSLYVWVKQEKLKGRKDTWLPFLGGLPGQWGGWGFAEEGQFVKEFLWTIDLYPKSPEDVQVLVNSGDENGFWESLKTDPLFRNQPEVLFGPLAEHYLSVDSSYVPGLHDRVNGCLFSDWLLANAFPALSWSMGSNANPTWIGEGRNVDMSSVGYIEDALQWPRHCRSPGGTTTRPEWHHSDYKDIAYFYVNQLYEKWLSLAEE